MSTFPRHIDYFNIVFLLGGTIGNVSWCVVVQSPILGRHALLSARRC